MQPNPGELVSGEGVRLALSSAGVGSRTIAAAIDGAIQALAFLVLTLFAVAFAGTSDTAALRAVSVIELVLIIAGYPTVMEWLTRGRTVGKMCLGLRVVRDDGGPIGFRQALVRGLAGLILEKPGLLAPFTTIAGVVTISTSRREKRIGDMMAGTVVLNERSAPQPLATPPAWVPPPLQAWVVSLDMHRLDDRLAFRMRQFVSRAHAMSDPAVYALGDDLRRRVMDVTSPPPPAGAPTPVVLMSVLAERRRRALAEARASQPQPQRRAAPSSASSAPSYAAPHAPPAPRRPADEPPELPFARPR